MADKGRALIIGLTGSIGSGKSYVLDLFASEGVPVQSSDAVAHELLDGEALAEVAELFPAAIVGGKVDRQKLGALVFADAGKKKLLEAILHPLVRQRNIDFAKNSSADFVVIEIPLLYESGAESYCDYVIALNVSRETMQKRAMLRSSMTIQKFEAILATQISVAEKVGRAEFVIENEAEHDTVGQVRKIIAEIRSRI